jgi:hypothetical protein
VSLANQAITKTSSLRSPPSEEEKKKSLRASKLQEKTDGRKNRQSKKLVSSTAAWRGVGLGDP